MYTNKINPLTNLPGTGLVIYGQKTLSSTPSSLDRINVARLVNYLRTQMNALARPFIFEPNDPITRNGIKSVVSSLLNDLVAKRGVTDYFVQCDTTNNTPERIARNELWVDVAVQPTKDVEFIYIPIRLKNPGEIQAGNLASATAVGTGA
jgi:phage tail sheath protein FI